jgi:hypothetical protein
LSGVEEHHASADRWKFVLHLIGLDGAVFRDYLFEYIAKSRNVPLSIAQKVELSALRVPRLYREGLVKGATCGNYAQVSVEHDKGLPNSVDDGLGQAMPVGKGVAIGHAGSPFQKCIGSYPKGNQKPTWPGLVLFWLLFG